MPRVSKLFPLLKPKSLCFPYLGKVSTKCTVFTVLWPPHYIFKFRPRQECIPVGCVPPAHWSYLATTHAHPPGAATHAPGSNHACPPREQPRTPPPVNGMTNRCKNITLPQTSFAGGNNMIVVLVLHIMRTKDFTQHNPINAKRTNLQWCEFLRVINTVL